MFPAASEYQLKVSELSELTLDANTFKSKMAVPFPESHSVAETLAFAVGAESKTKLTATRDEEQVPLETDA